MAQVTYRGVQYNTEDICNATNTETAELTYRGVKYIKRFNHLARLQAKQEKKNRLAAARNAFTQGMKAHEVA